MSKGMSTDSLQGVGPAVVCRSKLIETLSGSDTRYRASAVQRNLITLESE